MRKRPLGNEQEFASELCHSKLQSSGTKANVAVCGEIARLAALFEHSPLHCDKHLPAEAHMRHTVEMSRCIQNSMPSTVHLEMTGVQREGRTAMTLRSQRAQLKCCSLALELA